MSVKIDWPFDPAKTSSEYGPRRLANGDTRHHNGLDFDENAGQPVYACADGIIVEVFTEASGSELGNAVRIRHQEGPRISTGYAHLEHPVALKVGDKVKRGQRLGVVGDSGYTFGKHLHWEFWLGTGNQRTSRRVDPRVAMRKHGTGRVASKASRSSTGTPAATTSSKQRRVRLGNERWYWYRSRNNAAAMRNPQGKGRGQIMLTGDYPVLLIATNGAVQVLSNSMGKVWLHPSVRKHLA